MGSCSHVSPSVVSWIEEASPASSTDEQPRRGPDRCVFRRVAADFWRFSVRLSRPWTAARLRSTFTALVGASRQRLRPVGRRYAQTAAPAADPAVSRRPLPEPGGERMKDRLQAVGGLLRRRSGPLMLGAAALLALAAVAGAAIPDSDDGEIH